ncbi:MAG: Fe-S cluster assembly protein SufD [Bacteroidetes bacterium]|nr:Fe-S cluster assembly protein SufD [Bacteroidota bacterium]MCL5739073.1 Fe-S cluster assembly protein SufD [Bacteroidota bacterium]
MSETSEIKNWYLSLFKDFENHLNGEKSTPFHRLRKEAIDKFAELDFPNLHQEDWRFTDISPILKHTFTYANKKSTLLPDKKGISRFLFGGMRSHLVVFVNGFYSAELSTLLPLPKGVIIGSLAEALKSNDGTVNDNISKYATFNDNVFTALNTAFTIDGAYIYIPDNIVIEDPVHILFISHGSEKFISQPRNLIISGKNSQVKIIEHYESVDAGVYFTNSVTEIHAGESSVVDATKVQSENLDAYHVATTEVSLDSNSSYESHAVSLGANIYRHNLNVTLRGEGGDATLAGLYLLSGNQLSDTHSLIDHASPRCTSQEHYKGILDGKSRGVFNGKIMVRKGAQQTNSYQENRNIILSDEAKVDTKPQLEIFADDVKCSHGATVGQLSKESMFYLRSRGIGEEQAKSILIYAFAKDVLKGIKIDEVRSRLENILSERFLGKA